jgi:hypothetical protein
MVYISVVLKPMCMHVHRFYGVPVSAGGKARIEAREMSQ